MTTKKISTRSDLSDNEYLETDDEDNVEIEAGEDDITAVQDVE